VNFDLTEDEQMLKAVAERFLDNQYAGEERREYQSQPCGFEPRNWALLGELGILAASYPEEAGGLDLGATSISLIHHAMGRGLAVEPLIDCALLAGGILVRAQDEIAGQWADDLASGAKRAALAHNEFDAPGGWSGLRTQARKVGDTVQITGTKPFTMGGCGADLYLVSALDDDAADGGALYLVAADADGLDVETWRVADGSMAVMLRLTDVRPIARIENGARLLAQVEQTASLARSSEMVGIMERLFEHTLDYLRQREQFDQPLSRFQAIQHRMAALYAKLEQAKSLLDFAIVSEGTSDYAKRLDGARAFIAETGIELGHEAIQLHGAMGITQELSIGQGHKRLMVLSRWPEAPDAALDRFALAS